MSKLNLFSALLALVSVAACSAPAPADATPSTPSTPSTPADVAESDLSTSSTCDQSELFVKQGLAQDMRETLGASFVKDYQVSVPGALIAYDGYGGDIIQAPLGASAGAARVFDRNPGGVFSASFGGSSTNGNKFDRRGFAAAKSLFAAMNTAVETSTADQGWTTTTRTSKAGHFSCQQRTQGGSIMDASCSFGDLLMLHAVSWPKSATAFCVQ